MAERRDRRQWLIAMVLVVACVALIATSPPSSVSEAAEGEVEVAPGSPAEIHVRFAVTTDDQPTESMQVYFNFFEGQHEQRIAASTSASIGDSAAIATPAGSSPALVGSSLQLDPEDCIDACTVDATARLEWIGVDELSLRLHWEAVLTIRFGASSASATATVIEGAEPSPPRGVWVGLGALGAAIAGIFLAGRRSLWNPILAAVAIPLLAWRALANINVFVSPSGFSVHWSRADDLLVTLFTLVLTGGFAVGVWLAWRGRPSVLRVIGWMTVPIAAVGALLIVLDLPTYRPHEITAAAFVAGLPIASAVNADTTARADAAPSLSRATSFVVACHALMFAFAVGLATWLFLALIPATNLIGSSGWEQALIGFLVTVGVLALFVEGVRRWIKGEPRLLLLADLPFVLASLAVAGISFVIGGDGLFAPVEIETKAILTTAAIVALTGAIGLAVVPPPVVGRERVDATASEEIGHDERRQRDDVRGIANERDRDDSGHVG